MASSLLSSISGLVTSIGATLYAGVSLVGAAASSTYAILGNRYLLVWITLGLVFSAIWEPNHAGILQSGELFYRCTFRPILYPVTELLDALQPVVDSTVCWYNAAIINKNLFGSRIVSQTLKECTNGADTWNILAGILGSTLRGFVHYVHWLIAGIFTYPMPVEVVARDVQESLIHETRLALTCLCADLRVLWDVLLRAASRPALRCALHQGSNGFWAIVQIVAQYSYVSLFSVLQAAVGTLTLLEVYDSLLGTGDFALPTLAPAIERLAAGSRYGAYALNDLSGSLICTLYVEVEVGGTLPERELAFERCITFPGTVDRRAVCGTLYPGSGNLFDRVQCTQEATRNLNIFGALGATAATLLRATHAALLLAANAVRVVNDFITEPMGGRYLVDEWIAVPVFDTVRRPHPSFATPLPGGSSIEAPNVQLYGTTTALPQDLADCNVTSSTEPQNYTMVQCAQCPELAEKSIEEELLILTEQVDDLLEPSLGTRAITPLARLLFSPVRVLAAVAKFFTDFARYGASGIDELLGWLQRRRAVDEVWVELVGQPATLLDSRPALGGVLGALQDVVAAIEPRLICLYRLFALPVKAVAELLREGALVYTYLVASGADLASLSTYGPTLSEALSLEGVDKVRLDLTVYGMIRRPRDRSELTYLTSDPFAADQDRLPNLEYINVLPAGTGGPTESVWVECLDEVLTVDFLNQFLDPGDQLAPTLIPDMSCGLHYGTRVATEILRSLSEGVLGVLQTFFAVVNGSTTPDVLLRWTACSSADICSPLLELKSDLQDFLQCPCSFLGAIEINGEPIPCLCDGINSFVEAAVALLQAVYGALAAVGQTAICFTKVPFFDGDECQVHIYTRVLDSLERVLFANVLFGDAVGSVGCLLGTVFSFQDCGDSVGVCPLFTDFDTCDAAEIRFGGATPTLDWTRPSTPPGQAQECSCSPSVRFRVLFVRIYSLLSLLVTVPIDFVIQFIRSIKTGATGVFTGADMGPYINLVLDAIEDAVHYTFGRPFTSPLTPVSQDTCGRVETGAAVEMGILPLFASITRCIFPSPAAGNTLLNFSSAVISFSSFVIHQLRAFVPILLSMLKLFSGNTVAITVLMQELIEYLWTTFLCLVSSIGDVFGIVLATVRSLFLIISPDFLDPVWEFLFDTVIGAITELSDFIDTLLGNKRAAPAGATKRSTDWRLVNMAGDSAAYAGARLKRELAAQEAREREKARRRAHETGGQDGQDDQYWAATGREGILARHRSLDAHEWRMLHDVPYRAANMLQGSACARLTQQVAELPGHDASQLTPAEQLAYEACTMASYAGIATDVALFSNDEHAQGHALPEGTFYDLSAFATTMSMFTSAIDLASAAADSPTMDGLFVDTRHVSGEAAGSSRKRGTDAIYDDGEEETDPTIYETCQQVNRTSFMEDVGHCRAEDQVNPVYHSLVRRNAATSRRRRHNLRSLVATIRHEREMQAAGTGTGTGTGTGGPPGGSAGGNYAGMTQTEAHTVMDQTLTRLQQMRAQVRDPAQARAFAARAVAQMHHGGYRGPEHLPPGAPRPRTRWQLTLSDELVQLLDPGHPIHRMLAGTAGTVHGNETVAEEENGEIKLVPARIQPEREQANVRGAPAEEAEEGVLRISHPLIDYFSVLRYAFTRHRARLQTHLSETVPNHLADRLWAWYTADGTRTEAPDGIAGLIRGYSHTQASLRRAFVVNQLPPPPALPAHLEAALLAPATIPSGRELLRIHKRIAGGAPAAGATGGPSFATQNVTCGILTPCTGCAVVTQFIDQAVDNFAYCQAIDDGDLSVIPVVPAWQNPIPIERVPITNATSNTGVAAVDWVTGWLDELTASDAVATSVAFLTTTNTDPYAGYVGAWSYVPFVSTCDRDAHLSGAFGLGLKAGLWYAFWVTFAIGVALAFFSPALSNLLTESIAAITLLLIFGFVTLAVAYNYNASCAISVASLYSGPTPFVPIPAPLFGDVLALRDELLSAAWHWIPRVGSELSSPLEPACPTARPFDGCSALPISGATAWTGEVVYWLLPDVVPLTLYQFASPLLTPLGLQGALLDPFDEVAANYTGANLTLLGECRKRVGLPTAVGPALLVFALVLIVATFVSQAIGQVAPLLGTAGTLTTMLTSNSLLGGNTAGGSGMAGAVSGVSPAVAANGAAEGAVDDLVEFEYARRNLTDSEIQEMGDELDLDGEGADLPNSPDPNTVEDEGAGGAGTASISGLFIGAAPQYSVEYLTPADMRTDWTVGELWQRARLHANLQMHMALHNAFGSLSGHAKRQ